MKVLIIDDEPIVRRAFQRAFASRDHSVELASCGEEGQQKWLEFEPDLVLLDVLMPDFNGPQLLQNLKAKVGSSYIILMSAFTGDFDSQKAKAYGAHEFISKPFEDIFKLTEELEGKVP